jgi:hypothetical protein
LILGALVAVRCPFYGFRWPDNTRDLIQVGGNECGLDVQRNRPCKMEQEGRTVNFDYCDVPVKWKPLLDAFRHQIRFRILDAPEPVSLANWRVVPMKRTAS